MDGNQQTPRRLIGEVEPGDRSLSRTPYENRRRTPRHSGGGGIEIVFGDLAAEAIRAQLLDFSAMGFRITHHCPYLKTGEEVLFRRAGEEGTARVMWNRVLAQRVETGLLVLERGARKLRE
jgi:hypothetical protein